MQLGHRRTSLAAQRQLHAWWVLASGLQACKIGWCTGQLVDDQRGCAAPAGEPPCPSPSCRPEALQQQTSIVQKAAF